MHRDEVTIVSGLPRSGTSMMMRMLEAGGMEVLTDRLRKPDDDNPVGYYEFEPVKQLKKDPSWLQDARGKVVKVVSPLLPDLPRGYVYKVIFMRRKMGEILASQRQMLVRNRKPADAVSDDEMAALFQKHLRQVETWISAQPNLGVLYVEYGEVHSNPRETAARVNTFLGNTLNADEMAKVVEPSLYRQKA